MLMHHGPTIMEIVIYLGMVVGFNTSDGEYVEGRVVAADEEYVYLSRTKHHTVPLHSIKEIVKRPF